MKHKTFKSYYLSKISMKKSKKRSKPKKRVTKKTSKKKKQKINKNNLIIIGVVAVILIILICFFVINKPNKEKSKQSGLFTKQISPLELSQNKEAYEGKEILVLGAYIPSEAFIYVQETEDKIYLKPANRDYCRNYNLKGVLQYNSITKRWEFLVENYDGCLD